MAYIANTPDDVRVMLGAIGLDSIAYNAWRGDWPNAEQSAARAAALAG